jgi:hypothetical protein
MSLSLLALDTMVCTVYVGSFGCWYVLQDQRKVWKSGGGGSRNERSFNVKEFIFYFFENPREGDWFRRPCSLVREIYIKSPLHCMHIWIILHSVPVGHK